MTSQEKIELLVDKISTLAGYQSIKHVSAKTIEQLENMNELVDDKKKEIVELLAQLLKN